MKLSRDVLTVAILLGAFAVVSYVLLSGSPAQKPETTPRFTTYSSTKSGVRAFYLTLERLGYEVRQFRDEPKMLSSDTKALVAIRPIEGYPSLDPGSPLGRWVRNGGVALMFLGEDHSVPGLDPKALSPRASWGTGFHVHSPYSNGVKSLALRTDARIYGRDYRGLASDSHGCITAEIPMGRGKVIAVSDPWLASNSQLGKADNAVFLTNLISANVKRGGLVAFDEYSQGFAAPRTPLGVLPPAWRLALYQVLLAALLAMYSVGKRFGAIHPASDAGYRRPAHEYVQAIGRLYKKARAGGAALNMICESFRYDLCARIGIAADSETADIAQAAESATGLEADRFRRILERCASAPARELTDTELLELARAIKVLRKEIGIVGQR